MASHVHAALHIAVRPGGVLSSLVHHRGLPITFQPKCRTTLTRRGAPEFVAMAGHGAPGGVEQDLPEEVRAPWLCAGEEMQEDGTFQYGKVDGAHTWHEGDDAPWWDQIQQSLERAGGPVGFQKVLAWSFLPLLFGGLAFSIEPLYFLALTVLFIFAYIGQEMAKPTKYTAYEPEKSRGLL